MGELRASERLTIEGRAKVRLPIGGRAHFCRLSAACSAATRYPGARVIQARHVLKNREITHAQLKQKHTQ